MKTFCFFVEWSVFDKISLQLNNLLYLKSIIRLKSSTFLWNNFFSKHQKLSSYSERWTISPLPKLHVILGWIILSTHYMNIVIIQNVCVNSKYSWNCNHYANKLLRFCYAEQGFYYMSCSTSNHLLLVLWLIICQ